MILNIYDFAVQPGPDSVGIFAISQRRGGVAARACGLVSLEPSKVIKVIRLYLCLNNFHCYWISRLANVSSFPERISCFTDC